MDNIITRFLSNKPIILIFFTLILTGIFSYVSSSDNTVDEVSFNTGGKVFDLNEKITENFESPYHVTSAILESKTDDILIPESFIEI